MQNGGGQAAEGLLDGRSTAIEKELPQGSALTRLRVLVVLLGLWFFAGVGLSIYEEFRLSSTMPRQPDPVGGFVFPATVNHGARVYLDEYEASRQSWVYWFFVSAVVPFGAIGFLQKKWEVFPPYSKRRPR
jgi:hypothetical protein